MPNIKNESYWEEIESLPPFQQTENQHNYDEAWAALEKFQTCASPKLNAICLLALEPLLKRVYEAGKAAGEANAKS